MGEILLPKYDMVFKKIFGDQKHSDILIHFLNSIIETKIKTVEILSGDVLPEDIETKWSRLDVLAKTQEGELINIEIQIKDQGNMIPRSIYYWSQLFSGQLAKGRDYRELKRTISIMVLDFELFKRDERYWRKCYIKDDKTGERITELLEIHFLEIGKMKERMLTKDNPVTMWIEFLKNPFSKEVEEMEKKVPELKRAKEILEKVNRSPEDKERWRVREKAIMDEIYALNKARDEGIARGILKGREEGIISGMAKGRAEGMLENAKETAKRLLLRGMPMAEVSDITG